MNYDHCKNGDDFKQVSPKQPVEYLHHFVGSANFVPYRIRCNGQIPDSKLRSGSAQRIGYRFMPAGQGVLS